MSLLILFGGAAATADTVFRKPLVTPIPARPVQQPHIFPNLVLLAAVTFAGTGATTLPLLTASGTGTKARAGTGAATLPLITASGSGTKARAGTGSPSLPLLTASGSGTKARSGSGAPSLPLLTASGAGQGVILPPLRPVDLTPRWTVPRAQQPAHHRPTPDAAAPPVADRPFSQTEWWTPNPVLRQARQQPDKYGNVLQPVAGTHSGSGAATLPLLTASGEGETVSGYTPPVYGGLPGVGRKDKKTAKDWLEKQAKKVHVGSGAARLPCLNSYSEGMVWPKLEIVSFIPDEKILRPPLKFRASTKRLEVPQEPAIDYEAIRAAALAEMKRKRRKRDEEILLLL